MQFELTSDPNAVSYLIEIDGLPPGTNATLSVSETTAAGTGPKATLPLVVAAPAAEVPAEPPAIVEVAGS